MFILHVLVTMSVIY